MPGSAWQPGPSRVWVVETEGLFKPRSSSECPGAQGARVLGGANTHKFRTEKVEGDEARREGEKGKP